MNGLDEKYYTSHRLQSLTMRDICTCHVCKTGHMEHDHKAVSFAKQKFNIIQKNLPSLINNH